MREFTQKVTNEVAKSLGRNQTFLTSGRMYKPENTVHDRKFSIRLSINAYVFISLHVSAAFPSPDSYPGYDVRKCLLAEEQNVAETRRGPGGQWGKLPRLHNLSAHYEQHPGDTGSME